MQSDCERGGTCSDADKLLADIAADPKSHQQLSFERYQKELIDVHNPGVLAVPLGKDQQCYSTHTARTSGYYTTEHIFYLMLTTLGVLFPPVLLRITWSKKLAVLEKVKVTKGGPAVMWACIAWMPIANLYFTAKAITSISHFANNVMYQRENNIYMGLGVAVVLCCVTIAAVIQSGKPLPGLPNTRVLKSAAVRRVVKFHIWTQFNVFLTAVLAKSPFVVLIVGTNPFLYGSALLAIVLAASLLILLTATLFTFVQVFLGDPDFRLSRREAVRQAGCLLLAATGCAGVALFLGCICFLLLLSKGGNKVQSVTGVASFFMSHVVLTALPLFMRSLIRFIRNAHIYPNM